MTNDQVHCVIILHNIFLMSIFFLSTLLFHFFKKFSKKHHLIHLLKEKKCENIFAIDDIRRSTKTS